MTEKGLADASIWKSFNKEESQENSMYETEESLQHHHQQKPIQDSLKSRFYHESTTNVPKTKQFLKLIKQEIPNFSGFM